MALLAADRGAGGEVILHGPGVQRAADGWDTAGSVKGRLAVTASPLLVIEPVAFGLTLRPEAESRAIDLRLDLANTLLCGPRTIR
jgi:hypothetical protein